MEKHDVKLSNQLRFLREAYETEKARLLDEHMRKHYANTGPLWTQCKRASIEVASWPEWKRRRCYSQD